MDLKGSLVDTHVRIYPSDKLVEFIKSITPSDVVPHNILQIIKPNSNGVSEFKMYKLEVLKPVQLNNSEIESLKKIKEIYSEAHKEQKGVDRKENHIDKNIEKEVKEEELQTTKKDPNAEKEAIENKLNKLFSTETENVANNETSKSSKESLNSDASESKDDRPFFVTSDIDWLYDHLKTRRNNGDNDVPYLHTLLEGASIEMPENETLKRNPVLEARCVKLRAQQEAREYRKMTKSVDNVRMRFPEDSISYQSKYGRLHTFLRVLRRTIRHAGFFTVIFKQFTIKRAIFSFYMVFIAVCTVFIRGWIL